MFLYLAATVDAYLAATVDAKLRKLYSQQEVLEMNSGCLAELRNNIPGQS